jgi:hypothetical protein
MQCEHNVEFLNVEADVHKVTLRPQKLNHFCGEKIITS